MIGYRKCKDGSIAVQLEGRTAGHIKKNYGTGWYYQPRGSRQKGDVLPTVQDVKRSLEGRRHE